eukprot:NODE_2967_length_1305_cov_71.438240_g2818_i0.p1 GENE.NODE_2967_length_1305_cov_71.438240_g2818_i0~~NODE_2967_length_1305_cov_71.438240_g2818_i0.p1  ORF type:complete len:301 (+),score=60.43 NODE_2967_length_1305_cov_71.438240_g2818_i0:144-1046(+)
MDYQPVGRQCRPRMGRRTTTIKKSGVVQWDKPVDEEEEAPAGPGEVPAEPTEPRGPTTLYVRGGEGAVSPYSRSVANGTLDKPFATVADAFDAAQPNDTITLLEGSYTPMTIMQPPEGLTPHAQSKVKIEAEHDFQTLLFVAEAKNMTIKGLVFLGNDYRGCVGIELVACAGVNVTGNTFQHCEPAVEGGVLGENNHVIEGIAAGTSCTGWVWGILGYWITIGIMIASTVLVILLTREGWLEGSEDQERWLVGTAISLAIDLVVLQTLHGILQPACLPSTGKASNGGVDHPRRADYAANV